MAQKSDEVGAKDANDEVHETEYYGYEPKSPRDFPFDEDKIHNDDLGEELAHIVNPQMLRDHGRGSTVLLISMAFFALAFIILLVWQFLIADCKVKRLCDLIDRSSFETDDFTPKTFPFMVPSQFIWTSLLIASIGLLASCYFAFSVLKRNVGTPGMAEVARRIQQGVRSFMVMQYLVIIAPVFIMFIWIGVADSWRTACAFVIGAQLSTIVAHIGSNIATTGNIRTTAAAQDGVFAGMNIAFRSAASMGAASASVGVAGSTALYLILQDVASLSGLALGASVVALSLRMSGGLFAKGADIGADLIATLEPSIGEDDPRNPASVADFVGDNVGQVVGSGVDLFESFVGSIVATALLGSSLPFFYRNQYAMCVHNHLYIDEKCGPFGYPQQLSFASYICKQDELYLQSYPRLGIWQSNALFVALPFLLAAVGVIASLISTLYVRVASSADDDADKTTVVRGLLRNLRVNSAIASVLLVVGSTALCFGLFGGSSQFSKAQGLGNAQNLKFFSLADEPDACKNRYLEGNADSSLESAEFLPAGRFRLGSYSPLSTHGFDFGRARTTSFRLWGCTLVGVILGQVIRYAAAYFTASSHSPTRSIASSGAYGAGATIIEGFGVGMMSTIVPMASVVAAILISYRLFSFYGVGLSSVSMLSTVGFTLAESVYGSIADNAGGIARMTRPQLPRRVRETTDTLDAVGNTTAASGKGFANASSVLTAYALLAAVLQEGGMTPSSLQLVGNPRTLGPLLLGSADAPALSDVFVVASMFVGFMLPFLLSGLLLISVSRMSRRTTAEIRRQFRDIPGLLEGEPGVNPHHFTCSRFLCVSAILESFVPMGIVIIVPLIVGFGFGLRALIGMLVAAVGTGYLLATMMSNAGSSWNSAKKLVESSYYGETNGPGSEWHQSTQSSDSVGDSLKDAIGPSLNVAIKHMVSIALVASPMMRRDRSLGWIGAVILAVFAVIAVLLGLWIMHRFKKEEEASESESETDGVAGSKIKAPAKKVSPFYEPGSRWDPGEVVPGSQMHDAITAREITSGPQDVSRLAGMSDRESVDMDNLSKVHLG